MGDKLAQCFFFVGFFFEVLKVVLLLQVFIIDKKVWPFEQIWDDGKKIPEGSIKIRC